MTHSPAVRLAVAFACLWAGSAMAQANPVARAPQAGAPPATPAVVQEGFFRPTPDGDPSLTKWRPSAPTAPAPAVAPPPQATMVVVPPPALATRGPDSNPAIAAVDAARWNESQLDRVEREGERDRQRARNTLPPVAPGAWDGTTGDRNR